LIEALASFIPVVSTPVGMSVELLTDLKDCKVTKSFESSEICKVLIEVIDQKDSPSSFESWLDVIKKVDYATISSEYFEQVYTPLDATIIK
jgi:hypothetical protein